MKLLNYTLLYLSISLLSILSIWAVVFYFDMLDEVKASIDDGLDNYKKLIIYNLQNDTSKQQHATLFDNNYVIREITPEYAAAVRDTYTDTVMYMPRVQANETLRLLTTAYVANSGKFYELKVVSPVVEKRKLINKLLYSLIVLYIILIASISFVNNLVLKKIWKPFHNMLQQLATFKVGGVLLFQPNKTRIQEFKALDESIGSLLKRTNETFESQRHFIENAAHELQTPLAISLNKLELMAGQPGRQEQDVAGISDIIETLQGLTRLNKSLLLLSRIENSQFESDGNIYVNALVRKNMDRFADLAAFKEVTLHLIEEGERNIHMNRDLAMILITNLLKNAIVHNMAGGKVDIKISADTIQIENTGLAQPLVKERIFDRFYKNSTENSSTGLGLAIVRAITNLYGLSISYTYTGNHVFTIR